LTFQPITFLIGPPAMTRGAFSLRPPSGASAYLLGMPTASNAQYVGHAAKELAVWRGTSEYRLWQSRTPNTRLAVPHKVLSETTERLMVTNRLIFLAITLGWQRAAVFALLVLGLTFSWHSSLKRPAPGTPSSPQLLHLNQPLTRQ